MIVERWFLDSRHLTVETVTRDLTIPSKNIVRWSLDKKAEYQSGCVVRLVTCDDGNLQFHFNNRIQAVEMKTQLDKWAG